jgi:hypothetical protein
MRIQRLLVVLVVIGLLTSIPASAQTPAPCAKAKHIVYANVVAFDQLIMLNRRGASIPEGMIFALASDVVGLDGKSAPSKGNAMLRRGKRARPIVLRVNQYDCLAITFTNLLNSTPVNNAPTPPPSKTLQTATRNASIHINGMQLWEKISDDGSWVGQNATSLVAPGGTTTYNVYATEQGPFLLYSMGAVFGGSGTPNGGSQQTEGLFGAVHVEPPDAEWYRSQVTEEDLRMATTGHFPNKQPKLNYAANYPPGNPRGGKPILRMYTTDASGNRTLVYSDLTAVITGKNHGLFNPNLYPSNDPNGPKEGTGTNPNFSLNYAEPDRDEPYREFTIIYHELMEVTQALPDYYGSATLNTPGGLMNPVQDQFAINYGTGGIGTEILANRIGIGPEGGCPDCKYEEFFLDSWTVGDPSMIVNTTANASAAGAANPCSPWSLYGLANPSTSTKPAPCTPETGAVDTKTNIMVPVRKADYALYPDDPSNVYHSYLNDHVKFRILHGGTAFSHVHHQHAHQWLRTPNNNESTYLDSQLINPGSAYTLEITFGGSGNRNHTPGDSIFHCHFYPHFAGGMWSLWRVHDTFEPGTIMDKDHPEKPAAGYARALPDAEILEGTPTPAVVPLPTKAMAPMPAAVRLVQVVNPDELNPPNQTPPLIIGTTVQVDPNDLAKGMNPGYPFFIPGIAGVRAPHPPLDFAVEKDKATGKDKTLDGGLPRHLLISGTVNPQQMIPNGPTIFDFSKDLQKINAFQLPEDGTAVEQVAMDFHKKCNHLGYTQNTALTGKPTNFETNGLPPAHGAPYADPALIPFNPNDPPKGDERCKAVPACDEGTPVDKCNWKRYKAAVFQTDLVFNKQGWHYPQSRMLSLWQDVMPTLNGDRPPEPLFFRVESDDATEYWHTNLVPDYYQLDDYQVRTPTDIIGQHIHLVKFDVTSSDGASNGWNYEDGTLSPNEVQARMKSIALCKGLLSGLPPLPADGSPLTPPACGQSTPTVTRTALGAPQPPPFDICGTNCPADWFGAQTTVQRWMADPLKSPAEDPKIDRTLRTVFTHDHFGPSTHQQTGLYAAFVVEPAHTEWFQSETGQKMYTRTDGGPTSWAAVVQPVKGKPNTDANTFREFAIALQDFQLTYAPNSRTQSDPPKIDEPLDCNPSASTPTLKCGWADAINVINQSNSTGTNLSQTVAQIYANNFSQQTVSAGPTQGTYTFNYRNEPLPYRMQKPASGNPTDARAIDPAWVFASNVNRVNPTANPQPTPGGPICTAGTSLPGSPTPCPTQNPFTFPKKALTFDMQSGDPYTPLLRVYEKDNVQVRVIVGAHMLPHPFTIQGVKWHFEAGDSLVVAGAAAPVKNAKGLAAQPLKDINIVSAFATAVKSQDNSGFKSTQAMGISEHFEFLFRVPRSKPQSIGFTDFLYMPDSANPPTVNGSGGRGIVDGMWGIMRSYQSLQPADKPLKPLPNNIPPSTPPAQTAAAPSETPWWWATACTTANTKTFNVSAQNADITYNVRSASGSNPIVPIQFKSALVYHDDSSSIAPGSEPMILHANAGDCIQVTLTNKFDTTSTTFTSQNLTFPSISVFNQVLGDGNGGNNVQPIYAANPSQQAGLNPALLSYDVATSSGTNIGQNTTVATASPSGGTKTYYWYAGHIAPNGTGTPIEFGAVNLTPADPVQQDTYGLVAGLIVEPKGTVFCADTTTSNAMGTVYVGSGCTSKGAARFREFVLVTQDNVGNLPQLQNKKNNTQVSLNYRTEPMWSRFSNATDAQLNAEDLSPAYSNSLLNCTAAVSTPPNPACVVQCTTGPCDPQTPVFTVPAGMQTRLHMLHPGGSSDQQVFTINGHIWQDEPYTHGSTQIGTNPDSPWIGSRDLYGTNSAYTLVLPSAGGANKVPGDYLYRTHPANYLTQGLWGIIRVTPATTSSSSAGGGK